MLDFGIIECLMEIYRKCNEGILKIKGEVNTGRNPENYESNLIAFHRLSSEILKQLVEYCSNSAIA